MGLFPRGLLRRCLAVLAAVAFAATGPGLSGLEVVGHLSGLVDLTHERQPHFEEAGHSGHTDECRLGTAAFGIRHPSLGAPTLLAFAERAFEACFSGSIAPRPTSRNTGLPRAPPA